MITAAHAVSLDVAKTEVRAAMGAVSADHSGSSLAVAKKNQILTKHPYKRRLGLRCSEMPIGHQ